MKIFLIISLSVFLLLILTNCSPTTITVKENNQKEIITLNKGDIIKVVLNANPSTGYRWSLKKIDSLKVKIVDELYTTKKVQKDIVGSGGNKIYLFKAINKGNTTIALIYYRPFEKNLPPTKKFNINIDIR